MSWIRETVRGLEFKLLVQPRSAKNQIVGLHGDALKIKLTAPPVEGAANAMCIKFLAKCIGVPKSAIDIVSGQTGRNKRICVHWPEGRDGASAGKSLRASIESLI